MKFVRILVAFAAALRAQSPIESAWVRSASTDRPELRKIMPEVHEVAVQGDYVEIRSAGLSMTNLGVFQNPLSGEGGVRELRFRFPRSPQVSQKPMWVGPAEIGVFLNGVPLYNRFAGASYLGRNVWHFDTVAMSKSFGVLEKITQPVLLGFAMDGYPIYGPWAGVDGVVRRMSSGYRQIGRAHV